MVEHFRFLLTTSVIDCLLMPRLSSSLPTISGHKLNFFPLTFPSLPYLPRLQYSGQMAGGIVKNWNSAAKSYSAHAVRRNGRCHETISTAQKNHEFIRTMPQESHSQNILY